MVENLTATGCKQFHSLLCVAHTEQPNGTNLDACKAVNFVAKFWTQQAFQCMSGRAPTDKNLQPLTHHVKNDTLASRITLP